MFRAPLTVLAAATVAGSFLLASGVPAEAHAPTQPQTLRSAATPPPTPKVTLPPTLDVRPRYNPQNACDPVVRSGTRALGDLLISHYGRGTVGYERACQASTSEHYDGRALDWMMNASNPAEREAADAAMAWISANNGEVARRMGVQYMIWNGQIWRAYAPSRGWQAYKGASPHTDHVHISMTWDGAKSRTSWWSGQAVRVQDLTGQG